MSTARPDMMQTMIDKSQKPPVPLADRVRKSEAKLRKRGGRRLPGGSLQPDAALALDALMAAGYAPSATACIARALVEAAERQKVV